MHGCLISTSMKKIYIPLRTTLSLNVAFAHVTGQKFTAHAPCHVTCRQRVHNDRIFGIPKAILSLHYTTFVGLR